MNRPNLPSIADLRDAYGRGENIIRLLESSNFGLAKSEIIEIAYDIQSGSYTNIALRDPERISLYALEIYNMLRAHLLPDDVILDCGTGECTTLSALSHHISRQSRLLAFDISLSRLRVGRRFAQTAMKQALAQTLKLFVADMACIPLADCSVDVVLTVHALEPNHGREFELLKELLRVTRRKIILFEPSWENASDAARARMKNHGYVRNLPQVIEQAGGQLISALPLPNPLNPLNPTYCYIAARKALCDRPSSPDSSFACPRTGAKLLKQKGYWWSAEGGWAYPEIDEISCLRLKHGVLMSHE
jgi:hypothetical protein